MHKLLIALLASSTLLTACGITEPVKRDIVTQDHYQVCDIPDQDLVEVQIPTRTWDWSTKTDSDALDYINDLRDAIKTGNLQITDAGKVYTNCKDQANQLNNNKSP